METINSAMKEWLHQIGVADGYMVLFMNVSAVIGILVLAYFLNMICRKIVIPAIRKVTTKTDSVWDDHILSDDVLKGAREQADRINGQVQEKGKEKDMEQER